MTQINHTTALQQWTSVWLQAVVKAWTEPAFKARLLQDARAALSDFQYVLPASIDLQVIDFSEPNHATDVTLAPSFDTGAFMGQGAATLRIALLPPPADLSDAIVTLTSSSHPVMPFCVCTCF